MRTRRVIFGLIILTLLATCLAAAAKLRATPKFDRIRVGQPLKLAIDPEDVYVAREPCDVVCFQECDEGKIELVLGIRSDGMYVAEKRITRRGPLERLAWLAGWR